MEHAKKADLSVVLGSSLKGRTLYSNYNCVVTPACEFPELTLKNGGKVAIVNLMDTYLDDKCAVRIYAKIDDVFRIVMKELGT